jgi:hypothetical protein
VKDFFKGGDIVYFRNFIVIGLIIGAALCFPSESFAKNGDLHQKSVPTSSQIVQGKETVKSIKPSKDEKPVITKPNKHRNVVIPNHANEKAQEAVKASNKRVEDIVKNISSNKAKAKQGEKKQGIEKEKNLPPENASKTSKTEKFSNKSVHKQVSTQPEDTKRNQEKSVLSPIENSTQLPAVNKDDSSLASKPVTDKISKTEKEKVPSPQERYPKPIDVVNSSNSSIIPGGSQPKDRTGVGQSPTSLLEKWFVLENCLNFKLKQIYFSRANVYTNQWINAPPLQPPKDSLIF